MYQYQSFSLLLMLSGAKRASMRVRCVLQGLLKKCLHFSICACHPCAGAILIFSASLQVYQMIPEGNTLLKPDHVELLEPVHVRKTPERLAIERLV